MYFLNVLTRFNHILEGYRQLSQSSWRASLLSKHHFLTQLSFYPVLLSTGLFAFLFIGRVYFSQGRIVYGFLVWNLFLAWIPYLISLWAACLHRRHPGRWRYLLMPGILWLAFFPNAPYVITDFIHLRARYSVPIWYDIGLLATASWTGLFLAVFSLRTMQKMVQSFLGVGAGWLFVLITLVLGGLGVYLGRFFRWNSWDLLVQPNAVLRDIVHVFAHPVQHPQAIGFTIFFAAFLLTCYLTLIIAPATGVLRVEDNRDWKSISK